MTKSKFEIIKQYVKQNKRKITKAERLLYFNLRYLCKQKYNIKAKRQFLVYPYIADIFISKFGIIIEADGGIHNNRLDYDYRRDKFLESLGLLVLRISNFLIEKHITEVLQLIDEAIRQRQNYKPSIKYKLNNLENSPFSKTPKGQWLIDNFRKSIKNLG